MNLLTRSVRTPRLEIAFQEYNPSGSRCAVLMHGWPDSPETWKSVAPVLAAAGYRVLVPTLRGFGATRFLDPATPRSGQLSALGRDLLDFIAALGLHQPALIGHDWGARAVANACGLQPGVASHLVMLAVGYGTNDPAQALSYDQASRYWYHWFMHTPKGQKAVREDGVAFARRMWDTWAPEGWYREEDFLEAARSFSQPDWAEVVLHSYTHRWGFAPGDPFYDADEARLHPAPVLSVPTLILHGGADPCNPPVTSAGKEAFFRGRYERIVMPGVGHFPQREAADQVARQLLAFCAV